MDVFKNVDNVELSGMPLLSSCILMNSFQSVRTVSMTNAGAFEKDKQLSAVVERERRRKEEQTWGKKKATVGTGREWNRLDNRIGTIVVSDGGCKGGMPIVDCSRFSNLRELRVGDDCFEGTECVKLIGLKKLEKVVIGKDCFNAENTQKSGFYLKECEALKELTIGSNSFHHYRNCEIVNNSSLESIAMEKDAFYSSNSILKSVLSPSV